MVSNRRHRAGSCVLIPIEGSAQELFVQEQAVALAANLQVPLKAVHVSTQYEEIPKDLFRYVERLASKRHVKLEKRVIGGSDVAREIIDEAQPSDVIVIGTRLLGTEYHLGSLTETLIHRAPCPVQVIRIGPLRRERPRPAATARGRARRRKLGAKPPGWGADP